MEGDTVMALWNKLDITHKGWEYAASVAILGRSKMALLLGGIAYGRQPLIYGLCSTNI